MAFTVRPAAPGPRTCSLKQCTRVKRPIRVSTERNRFHIMRFATTLISAVFFFAVSAPVEGQVDRGAAPSAQTAAPVDLTGFYVSVVTEDWRYRMMTPP